MEPTDHNLRAWNQRHARAEAGGLPESVRARLPDLARRHVLHLGCGDGAATAGLVELGALVTGVDPSPEALEAARERLPDTALIASELDQLPLHLCRGRFDVVLSGGAFLDLARWTSAVSAALRPGGELLFHDIHPISRCLDAALRWRGSYFDSPLRTLADIVNAVAAAGLVVTGLEELPEADRQRQDPRVPGELLLAARKPA